MNPLSRSPHQQSPAASQAPQKGSAAVSPTQREVSESSRPEHPPNFYNSRADRAKRFWQTNKENPLKKLKKTVKEIACDDLKISDVAPPFQMTPRMGSTLQPVNFNIRQFARALQAKIEKSEYKGVIKVAGLYLDGGHVRKEVKPERVSATLNAHCKDFVFPDHLIDEPRGQPADRDYLIEIKGVTNEIAYNFVFQKSIEIICEFYATEPSNQKMEPKELKKQVKDFAFKKKLQRKFESPGSKSGAQNVYSILSLMDEQEQTIDIKLSILSRAKQFRITGFRIPIPIEDIGDEKSVSITHVEGDPLPAIEDAICREIHVCDPFIFTDYERYRSYCCMNWRCNQEGVEQKVKKNFDASIKKEDKCFVLKKVIYCLQNHYPKDGNSSCLQILDMCFQGYGAALLLDSHWKELINSEKSGLDAKSYGRPGDGHASLLHRSLHLSGDSIQPHCIPPLPIDPFWEAFIRWLYDNPRDVPMALSLLELTALNKLGAKLHPDDPLKSVEITEHDGKPHLLLEFNNKEGDNYLTLLLPIDPSHFQSPDIFSEILKPEHKGLHEVASFLCRPPKSTPDINRLNMIGLDHPKIQKILQKLLTSSQVDNPGTRLLRQFQLLLRMLQDSPGNASTLEFIETTFIHLHADEAIEYLNLVSEYFSSTASPIFIHTQEAIRSRLSEKLVKLAWCRDLLALHNDCALSFIVNCRLEPETTLETGKAQWQAENLRLIICAISEKYFSDATKKLNEALNNGVFSQNLDQGISTFIHLCNTLKTNKPKLHSVNYARDAAPLKRCMMTILDQLKTTTEPVEGMEKFKQAALSLLNDINTIPLEIRLTYDLPSWEKELYQLLKKTNCVSVPKLGHTPFLDFALGESLHLGSLSETEEILSEIYALYNLSDESNPLPLGLIQHLLKFVELSLRMHYPFDKIDWILKRLDKHCTNGKEQEKYLSLLKKYQSHLNHCVVNKIKSHAPDAIDALDTYLTRAERLHVPDEILWSSQEIICTFVKNCNNPQLLKRVLQYYINSLQKLNDRSPTDEGTNDILTKYQISFLTWAADILLNYPDIPNFTVDERLAFSLNLTKSTRKWPTDNQKEIFIDIVSKLAAKISLKNTCHPMLVDEFFSYALNYAGDEKITDGDRTAFLKFALDQGRFVCGWDFSKRALPKFESPLLREILPTLSNLAIGFWEERQSSSVDIEKDCLFLMEHMQGQYDKDDFNTTLSFRQLFKYRIQKTCSNNDVKAAQKIIKSYSDLIVFDPECRKEYNDYLKLLCDNGKIVPAFEFFHQCLQSDQSEKNISLWKDSLAVLSASALTSSKNLHTDVLKTLELLHLSIDTISQDLIDQKKWSEIVANLIGFLITDSSNESHFMRYHQDFTFLSLEYPPKVMRVFLNTFFKRKNFEQFRHCLVTWNDKILRQDETFKNQIIEIWLNYAKSCDLEKEDFDITYQWIQNNLMLFMNLKPSFEDRCQMQFELMKHELPNPADIVPRFNEIIFMLDVRQPASKKSKCWFDMIDANIQYFCNEGDESSIVASIKILMEFQQEYTKYKKFKELEQNFINISESLDPNKHTLLKPSATLVKEYMDRWILCISTLPEWDINPLSRLLINYTPSDKAMRAIIPLLTSYIHKAIIKTNSDMFIDVLVLLIHTALNSTHFLYYYSQYTFTDIIKNNRGGLILLIEINITILERIERLSTMNNADKNEMQPYMLNAILIQFQIFRFLTQCITQESALMVSSSRKSFPMIEFCKSTFHHAILYGIDEVNAARKYESARRELIHVIFVKADKEVRIAYRKTYFEYLQHVISLVERHPEKGPALIRFVADSLHEMIINKHVEAEKITAHMLNLVMSKALQYYSYGMAGVPDPVLLMLCSCAQMLREAARSELFIGQERTITAYCEQLYSQKDVLTASFTGISSEDVLFQHWENLCNLGKRHRSIAFYHEMISQLYTIVLRSSKDRDPDKYILKLRNCFYDPTVKPDSQPTWIAENLIMDLFSHSIMKNWEVVSGKEHMDLHGIVYGLLELDKMEPLNTRIIEFIFLLFDDLLDPLTKANSIQVALLVKKVLLRFSISDDLYLNEVMNRLIQHLIDTGATHRGELEILTQKDLVIMSKHYDSTEMQPSDIVDVISKIADANVHHRQYSKILPLLKRFIDARFLQMPSDLLLQIVISLTSKIDIFALSQKYDGIACIKEMIEFAVDQINGLFQNEDYPDLNIDDILLTLIHGNFCGEEKSKKFKDLSKEKPEEAFTLIKNTLQMIIDIYHHRAKKKLPCTISDISLFAGTMIQLINNVLAWKKTTELRNPADMKFMELCRLLFSILLSLKAYRSKDGENPELNITIDYLTATCESMFGISLQVSK